MTASVGDTLEFTWSGTHNVYVMPNAEAVEACDFSSATLLCATSAGGSCTATLDTLPAYFACEVAGHCQGGQHLTVSGNLSRFAVS